MSKLIYVIDDEENIRELIEKYLIKEGYKVKTFNNSDYVLETFEKDKPDMIILDIMMPGIDGFEICKKIRKINNVPIIFVSAKDEEFDRILGIELGADDYLSKPFSPRELIVRIKAIFRRIEPSHKDENLVILKDISIYKDERKVLVCNNELELTTKEYDLLTFMIENKNKVYTREQLLNSVWGYDYIGDERSIDDLIKRIRKKIIEKGSSLEIKTIWGYGYKING